VPKPAVCKTATLWENTAGSNPALPTNMMNSRKQGSIGVAIAISWFTQRGYHVAIPISETSRYDLIVDHGLHLQRVECKTTRFRDGLYYVVALQTCGGNRSGTGKRTKLSKADCDLVFVHCDNGDDYLIPASEIDGRASLTLTPKWSPWKIANGRLAESG
jgi:hypothetical protein